MRTKHNTIKASCLAVLLSLITLTLALIPINVLCTNFPEWVITVLSVFLCCGLIIYLIVFKTKLATKIILPIFFGSITIICSFAPYLIPYWDSYTFKNYNGAILNFDKVISYKEAENDFKELKYRLEKIHPMFKKGLTEDVEFAYLQALERLKKAESITVNDLRREIQTVLHPMHDAHTSTYNNYPDDKFLKTSPQKSYEGYKLSSVNGKNVEQIIQDAKPYFCYETEDWIDVDLGSLAALDFYGFTSPFTFEWAKDETVVSEVYTEDDFIGWSEYQKIYNQYFANSSDSKSFVYYEVDEEKNCAILTLTKCKYNQAYIDCVKSMFKEIKQKSIQNVAVDLRGNGGGSSIVANEFIKYLPVESYLDVPYEWRFGLFEFSSSGKTTNDPYNDLTFKGNVYVLTDNKSFSSAKDFAMIIQDNKLGEIIGEHSANSVNGYGEVVYFYLPNTGLFVQISTKKWYRIDETNTNNYVMPNYPCESENAIEELYEIITG